MIYCGNNIDILRGIKSETYHSVVTDCPYGLGNEPDATKMLQAWLDYGYLEVKGSGFMNHAWDSFVPQPNFWKECFRVLKPGGYVVSFFGTRTYDWGVMAMRLAGFEIRDQISWIFGSGFPKGKNIEKDSGDNKFRGWNTALKPAYEPIVLARKPINCKTVAENMIKYHVGAYNVGATRIGTDARINGASSDTATFVSIKHEDYANDEVIGRYPTNVLLGHHPDCQFIGLGKVNEGKESTPADLSKTLDSIVNVTTNVKTGAHLGEEIIELYECHPDCPIKMLDKQSGVLTCGSMKSDYKIGENGNLKNYGILGERKAIAQNIQGSSGGASRFFYCAKASGDEREIGVKSWQKKGTISATLNKGVKANELNDGLRYDGAKAPKRANNHPTVKPVEVMRYLIRLVAPKGAKILDPFCGSGTTGVAAKLEGIDCDLIDMDEYNCSIAEARMSAWNRQNTIDDFFG